VATIRSIKYNYTGNCPVCQACVCNVSYASIFRWLVTDFLTYNNTLCKETYQQSALRHVCKNVRKKDIFSIGIQNIGVGNISFRKSDIYSEVPVSNVVQDTRRPDWKGSRKKYRPTASTRTQCTFVKILFGNYGRKSQLRIGIRWVRDWIQWLRIWTTLGLLWTQCWTFGFHKKRGISCLYFRTQLRGYRRWREWGTQPKKSVPNYRSAAISFSTTLLLRVVLVTLTCAQWWHDTLFPSAFSPRPCLDILSIGQQV
jgi:hypothetical protein